MKNTEISLILPCYNEAEHFEVSAKFILDTLRQLKLNFEIIFVEDKSTDNTRELIKKYINNHSQYKISAIYHKQNLGRGASVRDGIMKASCEIVGFIDIDCEVSPKNIPEFIRKLNDGYDITCGLRIYKTTPRSLIRAIASKLYAYVVRTFLSTGVRDTEAGYKFFHRSAILKVLNTVKDTHWFWDTEIMVRSEKKGLKIASIPVQFQRRPDKTSTVRLAKDTLIYLRKLIAFQIELKKNDS